MKPEGVCVYAERRLSNGYLNVITFPLTLRSFCVFSGSMNTVSQFTTEQLRHFRQYREVQSNGRYNMLMDSERARMMARLSPSAYAFVQDNYGALAEAFAAFSEQPTHRQRIKAALTKLSRTGFTTRMNFSCCQGCAWAELSAKGKKDGDDIVFFHRQDNEAFDEDGNLKESLHIAHSGHAYQAVDALRAEGLTVEWDGDTSTRIEVKAVA